MHKHILLLAPPKPAPTMRPELRLEKVRRRWSSGLLLLLALTLGGCARNYVITLSNGNQITTASKPKLQGASYVFKDGRGQNVSLPAGRVREIAPASMAKEQDKMFIPSTSR